jgi:hypothetical protein
MLLRALLLLLCLLPPVSAQDSTSCMECHAGIEPMHPESGLSCTGCHGGDGSARTKEGAHVTRPRVNREDERVARQDEDLAWRRFANPFDLRVAPQLCGPCHSDLVEHLRLSLHGTTAGHLSDGFYEAGILAEKGSKFSVFPVQATAPKRSETSMDRLLALPAVREGDVLNALPRSRAQGMHAVPPVFAGSRRRRPGGFRWRLSRRGLCRLSCGVRSRRAVLQRGSFRRPQRARSSRTACDDRQADHADLHILPLR